MAKKQIAIIDYGMGNIYSVISAFNYLGVAAELVDVPEDLAKFSYLVLPGVGSFRKGMEVLRAKQLDEAIRESVVEKGNKILGICLGMQLLGSHSTEDGDTEGLGLIDSEVDRFNHKEIGQHRVPHVGFNSVEFSERAGLFRNLRNNADFYFTHSYRMSVCNLPGRSAICLYGIDFLAAFEVDNICGTQFHPEKSQTNGLILLRNFLQSQC